ncbi:MAG: hypothetical protein RIC55_04805 [Pirellulaceae bacterium]
MNWFVPRSLLAGVLAVAASCFAPRLRADELSDVRDQFAAQFEAIAATCDEQTRLRADVDLSPQARRSRAWIATRDPRRQYLFVPGIAAERPIRRIEGNLVPQWRTKFQAVRDQYAEALFQQARRIHAAGDDAQAYRLLHEVLRENPAHAAARKMLRPVDLAAGIRVIRAGDEPLLEWRGGSYWRVESPHFEILTNITSGADAQAMAERMEMLYAVWRQLFYEYWIDEARGKLSFVAETAPVLDSDHRYRVVVFRERQEYVVRLTALGASGAAQTEGYYADARRRSFFYAGDEEAYGTWYHEITHQLFQETGRAIDKVADDGNVWLVEGVAMYLESLQPYDGYCTVGGFDARRLQYARHRRIVDGFHMPLEELTRLGREQLAQHPDIRRLYSECCGLAHFLMDGADGRYRRPAIELLKAIYAGRAAVDALPRLTAQSFPQLDEQYPYFLANVGDDDLARYLMPPERLTALALPGTRVTDAGVAHLAACRNLTWLDLAATKVTDEGVGPLGALRALERLSLRQTAIGDAALATVAEYSRLDDLNLAQTAVTDRGLLQLRDLRNLTAIWLEQTAVGDDGVAALSRLGKLEVLDLAATRITDDALQHLGGLRNLAILYLSHTNVTDAGLLPLRRLRQLQLVQLDGTKVTSEGAVALKNSLPAADVILTLK